MPVLLDGLMAAYSYKLVMKSLTYLCKMRNMIKHTFSLDMTRLDAKICSYNCWVSFVTTINSIYHNKYGLSFRKLQFKKLVRPWYIW